jgi:hypothetical protein
LIVPIREHDEVCRILAFTREDLEAETGRFAPMRSQ